MKQRTLTLSKQLSGDSSRSDFAVRVFDFEVFDYDLLASVLLSSHDVLSL